ncbi:ComF family protein [Aequitasia blattaphilus]|uniref:ComF family protein n=1 Tax=Aequitasia blattaphilus TaxID=2949332 RepID=A0ABT1E6C1_9FIRM|nr:ComF family protein [Aequitasia blattaphilus]MCP1101382.1 ComF family protein [Aequitasia blattaphilus]MCR8614022.1 ComF family protein [Aequitasia blattaphilus]
MKEQINKLIWPEVCPICQKVSKTGVCTPCAKKLNRYEVQEPSCLKCGKPIENECESMCHDCERRERSFERGRGIFLHSGVIQKAIYRFKYHNQRYIGRFFANEMAVRGKGFLRNFSPEILVPVPIDPWRKKERGYNQTLILAQELEIISRIPTFDCVKRVRRTMPQKGLSKEERKGNLKDAFQMKGALKNVKKALIVDDIFTTGSTIEELADLLRKVGVQEVGFLTISIGQGK